MAAAPDDPVVIPAANFREASTDTSFVIHNLPGIIGSPEVIVLCTVRPEDPSSRKQEWLILDFLFFKSMLRGEGHKDAQVYLSSVPIPTVAEMTGAGLHHDQGAAKSVMAANDNFINIHKSPQALLNAFLHEIKTRSENAKKKGTSLLIIACGPTTAEQDICLDLRNQIYAKKDIMRLAICSDVPVTLMTPSLFSGGWLVNPQLGTKASIITKETAELLVMKQSGAASAARFINIFRSGRLNPLLVEGEQTKLVYDDMLRVLKPAPEAQTTYAIFHKTLHSLLETRFTAFPTSHGFHWDIEHDEWERDWASRTGPPIAHWEAKWNNLPPAPAQEEKIGLSFLGNALGGTWESQIAFLKFLAEQELLTCSSDWSFPGEKSAENMLQSFIESRDSITEGSAKQVYDYLEYRASKIYLADLICKHLGLPRPQDKSCRYWDRASPEPTDEEGRAYRDARVVAFGEAVKLFHSLTLAPFAQRIAWKELHCWRPCFYLAAAISLKFRNEGKLGRLPEIRKYVQTEVASVFNRIFDLQKAMLFRNEPLMELCKKWLRSRGLKCVDGTISGHRIPIASGQDLKAASHRPKCENDQVVTKAEPAKQLAATLPVLESHQDNAAHSADSNATKNPSPAELPGNPPPTKHQGKPPVIKTCEKFVAAPTPSRKAPQEDALLKPAKKLLDAEASRALEEEVTKRILRAMQQDKEADDFVRTFQSSDPEVQAKFLSKLQLARERPSRGQVASSGGQTRKAVEAIDTFSMAKKSSTPPRVLAPVSSFPTNKDTGRGDSFKFSHAGASSCNIAKPDVSAYPQAKVADENRPLGVLPFPMPPKQETQPQRSDPTTGWRAVKADIDKQAAKGLTVAEEIAMAEQIKAERMKSSKPNQW